MGDIPMKTIAELNTKWWYRFLKVGYFPFFFLILIGSPIGIFYAYEPIYDDEKSYIKCANGKEFLLRENGIFLYSKNMDSYDKEKAENLCSETLLEKAKRLGITPAGAKAELERRKLNINDLPQGSYEVGAAPWETRGESFRPLNPVEMTREEYKAKYGELPPNSYELISKYIPRNWLATISFSILSILTTLFIFEFVRRSFYYILLGNLFPKS